jgi:hypothetical protein
MKTSIHSRLQIKFDRGTSRSQSRNYPSSSKEIQRWRVNALLIYHNKVFITSSTNLHARKHEDNLPTIMQHMAKIDSGHKAQNKLPYFSTQ